MQFIPEDAYQYLQMMSGLGMPASGTEESDYSAWEMDPKPYVSTAPTPHLATTSIYLVEAFPQGDFADRIDIHPDLPMMLPASGTNPPILGIFSDEKTARIKMEEDDQNVHLMYKCRVPGVSGIQNFLELMAGQGMLETVAGN